MTASNSVSGEVSVSSAQVPPVKKKRSLPGMPDPNAEVIALSPKSLLATNRFVCEICNKGFQRDQNLQLHRRGHNLPWKLRQRTGKEARKRVYVCPEPSCVHHDPSRALGDLTGIKKHFCRKHGEKKWKCDKCSKKYAVQSDWKAHNKTCGTREYRCDCGTLFSRRDSFVTHRAFCEALAENSLPPPANSGVKEEPKASPLSALPIQQMPLAPPEVQEQENANKVLHCPPQPAPVLSSSSSSSTTTTSGGSSNSSPATTSKSTSLFASLFPSSAPPATATQATSFSNLINADASVMEPPLLCLSSFFPLAPERRQSQPSPHMSATALLQKAAQMGTTSSSSSFLRSLGLATSSTNNAGSDVSGRPLHWSQQQQQHAPFGLGLGLAYDSSGVATANLPELMMGSSSLFGPKPATLDFLSLGTSPAFMTSMGGGVGSSQPEKPWEAADPKPDSSTFPYHRTS
uniref:Protein EARLY HEADING DATE 2 n=1 Tax=Cymbidium ensifolium TaxID=78740 RepID=A0A5B9MRV2_CYMEN|nr:indeterminate-domain 2-like protein isoform X1 [Cymbidium ensifolium]